MFLNKGYNYYSELREPRNVAAPCPHEIALWVAPLTQCGTPISSNFIAREEDIHEVPGQNNLRPSFYPFSLRYLNTTCVWTSLSHGNPKSKVFFSELNAVSCDLAELPATGTAHRFIIPILIRFIFFIYFFIQLFSLAFFCPGRWRMIHFQSVVVNLLWYSKLSF